MSADHGSAHHNHHMTPAVAPVPGSMSHHPVLGGEENTHSEEMHMMQMYFHAGYEPYVLIKQWAANDTTGMVLTCFFFFVLAILYELLKAYRRVLAVKIMQESVVHLSVSRQLSNSASNPGDGNTYHESNEPVVHITTGSSNRCDKNTCSSSSSSVMRTNGDVQAVDAEVEERLTGGGRKCNRQQHQHESSSIDLFSSWSEMFTCSHLRSTLLYLLQVMFAYLLMLAFMLFNIWIAGAILVGAAVGHFLISQKAIALQDATNEDSCH